MEAPVPRIHTSELPPVETPTTPIWQTVLADAPGRGDHPALIDGITGQTISYAQLAHMVERVAAGGAQGGGARAPRPAEGGGAPGGLPPAPPPTPFPPPVGPRAPPPPGPH